MRFLAHYQHRRHEQPPYYRTLWADSVNEATRQADRYTRKGFVCVGVVSRAA